MINLGQAIGYLMLDTSSFQSSMQSAISDLRNVGDSSQDTNSRINSLSSGLGKMGASMTKNVTLPLVGVGAAATNMAMDYEAQMSKVQAISGATGEQMDQLNAKALEMGAKTKFSASESGEAFEYMAMAGWKSGEMIEGIDGIMSLAAASGEDLATTSDIVTDALTAFGLEAGDAGHFADILAVASSNANTNVSMLGESFKYVAPVAGSLGYSAEDTSIALGLMANSGIKASQAGTSLRAALTRMVKPTDDAAATMENLGISLTHQDGTMKSLGEVMDNLRESMGQLDEAEQSQVAAAIFGQEAMSGMLAIINASPKDYEDLTNAIYNSKDAAQEMADTMMNNGKGSIEQMTGAIETLMISVGQTIAPVVTKVVEFITTIVEKINSLPEPVRQVVVVIGMVAAAIGPVLLIGSKLVSAIGQIREGVSSVINFVTSMNPTILAIVGILAAVAAAVALFYEAWTNNWGGIQDKVQAVVDFMKPILQTVVDFFQNIFIPAIVAVAEAFKAQFQLVISFFTEILWPAIKTVAGAIVDAFKAIADYFMTNWWPAIKGIVETFQTAFKAVVDFIKTNIIPPLKESFENFKTTFDTVMGTIKRIWDDLWTAVKAVFGAFKAVFTGDWKGAWENIKKAGSAIWDGIKAAFGLFLDLLVTTVKNIGSKLKDAAKSAFHALWDGFKSKWNDIKGWVEEKFGWISDMFGHIKDFVKGIGEAISGVSSSSGSYAVGISRVPYDGFVATLHEGEAVLTKNEAQAYRQGAYSSGGDTFNFYSPKALTVRESVREFKKAKRNLLGGFS